MEAVDYQVRCRRLLDSVNSAVGGIAILQVQYSEQSLNLSLAAIESEFQNLQVSVIALIDGEGFQSNAALQKLEQDYSELTERLLTTYADLCPVSIKH